MILLIDEWGIVNPEYLPVLSIGDVQQLSVLVDLKASELSGLASADIHRQRLLPDFLEINSRSGRGSLLSGHLSTAVIPLLLLLLPILVTAPNYFVTHRI